MRDPKQAFSSWKCLQCGELVGEFYMVHNHLWELAIPIADRKRMAHLRCFSELLGRRVTVDDLTDAQCNQGYRWFATTD